MIHAVVAINNLGYIGNKDGLPWAKAQYQDLRLFWKMITNETVIVGGNTYKHMPKERLIALTKRVIVASRENGNTVEHLLQSAIAVNEDVYVIGGKQIYEAAAPYVDVWHITRIDDNTIGDAHLDIKTIMYI